MAEQVGFEPTRDFRRLEVFETTPFGHLGAAPCTGADNGRKAASARCNMFFAKRKPQLGQGTLNFLNADFAHALQFQQILS